jgi:hypothetical protein
MSQNCVQIKFKSQLQPTLPVKQALHNVVLVEAVPVHSEQKPEQLQHGQHPAQQTKQQHMFSHRP